MLDADDCLYDRLLDVTAAREWYAIESAACLAHEGEERRAETCRAAAGYATLSPMEQHPLLGAEELTAGLRQTAAGAVSTVCAFAGGRIVWSTSIHPSPWAD